MSGPVVALVGGPVLLDAPRVLRQLLKSHHADAVPVDLLVDRALPPGTRVVILGDGAPAPHAAGLAANESLRAAMVALHADGGTIVAQGAGTAYLGRTLDGHEMCGLLPVDAVAGPGGVPALLELDAPGDGPVAPAGTRAHGRPTAAVVLEPGGGEPAAWTVGSRPEGFVLPNLHASAFVLPWNRDRSGRVLRGAGFEVR